MDQFTAVIVAVAVIFALLALLSHRRKVQRRKYLIEKYGLENAERIIAKRVWQGMTTEQLVESWGRPEDVDEKVLKTKTKETWKYGNNGKNRYRQRVYIEDSYVVGWQSQ